jgi:hypothetical protein
MITGHWPAACVDHNSDGFAIRVRLPQVSLRSAVAAPQLAIG